MALCAMLILCGTTQAGESTGAGSPADKSQYTLFNPTPASQMREFNTDRPDVTESPYTVDAGHFQIELSFVEYTHDSTSGVQSENLSILPANLKVGLLNNFDLQLVLEPYAHTSINTHGSTQRLSGFGDTELRGKLNLWGDDGGLSAGAVMPFVRLPTGTGGQSDHHVEGGIILPLALTLPAGFDLGTMAEFDVDRNPIASGYGVDFIHTVTLGHPLWSEKLAAYVEYVGVSPISTGHTYLAYFDTGLTYALTENVQLDTGINLGLSDQADDYTVFVGLSVRF